MPKNRQVQQGYSPVFVALNECLMAAHPFLYEFTTIDSAADDNLRIHVLPPTGNERYALEIWVEDQEPAIGWGPWHSHASLLAAAGPESWNSAIVKVVAAIISDKLVLAFEEDCAGEIDWAMVDLEEEDAMVDLLTSPYSSGSYKLITWSGKGDRRITIESLGIV